MLRGQPNGLPPAQPPSTNSPTPPLRTPDPWADFAELRVTLRKIPKAWGTLDVYKVFTSFGNLARIELFEPRADDTVNGSVVFRPPPRYILALDRYVVVKDRQGHAFRIECGPSRPSHEFQHPSPVTPVRTFPERMAVKMVRLDIGVMKAGDQMLVLHTARPAPQVPLELAMNLQYRKLDLKFGYISPDASQGHAADFPESCFKLEVDFTQLDQVFKVMNGKSDDCVLMLQLKMPPLFLRKTEDLLATHDAGSTIWNEHQTWFRQTGVHASTGTGNDAVQLQQNSRTVDVGRWLTYRLVFDKQTSQSRTFLTMCQALMDHNIDVTAVRSMTIKQGDADTMWAWSSSTGATKNAVAESSWLSDMHQMASPISQLDFLVRYHLEVCVSQGFLHECNINSDFLERLAVMEPARATKLLEKVTDNKERHFDPMTIFKLQSQVSVKERKTPRYCTRIPSAIVTPTTIYFATPVLETSNRVIRNYRQHEDRFLRVKFTDERYKGKIMPDDNDTRSELFARVKRSMTSGIKIGDRRYEFLAFGNSQFREHGAYFFASTSALTAAMIRQWMGDFSTIEVVAKYASRIGQCFSTTRAMAIGCEIERIADIKRNGFTFTDGVGKISPFLAQMIAEEYGLPNSGTDYPSVFQFRLGGCKGVLAVDPQVRGQTVCIRPSQEKFAARHHGLEICRISQFSAAYLNMQLILVLSALGIPDWVFLTKMRDAVSALAEAMTSPNKAVEQLQKNIDFNSMTLTLATMVRDFMDINEPFVTSCLHLWRSWMMKYLKEKARILVDQGAFVLGCVDETGVLRGHFDVREDKIEGDDNTDLASLPEVFLQIPDPQVKGKYRVIEGICALARNPSLHPGDTRVVRAVDTPKLRHLKNCVVLPQTGDRDLANMCSGGDLDGDDYLLMWDSHLIPEEWNHPPMSYQAPPPVVSNGPVTVDDMTSFFVKHMKNDNLSRIAVAHRYWADAQPEGVKDEKCLELAQLHSLAVDFAKTGVPAKMPKRLQVKRWPHWAEVKGRAKSKVYRSNKILGRLYDEVQRVPFSPAWEAPFDARILTAFEPTDSILQDAREVKQQYDKAIRRVMAQFGIKTEIEVWTTFVLEHSNEFGDWKFAETIGEAVANLKKYHQELCYERAGTTLKERERAKMDPFIVAMYQVTADEIAAALAECSQMKVVGGREVPVRQKTAASMPFLSFPWLFHNDLVRIATKRPGSSDELQPIVVLPTKKASAKSKYASLLGEDFELPPLQEVTFGEVTVQGGDVLELFPDNDNNNTAAASPSTADLHHMSSDTVARVGSQTEAVPLPLESAAKKDADHVDGVQSTRQTQAAEDPTSSADTSSHTAPVSTGATGADRPAPSNLQTSSSLAEADDGAEEGEEVVFEIEKSPALDALERLIMGS